MGHTNYWKRPNRVVSDQAWDAFTDDVRKIFAAHSDIICLEYDKPDRKALVTDTEVRFNGKGGGGCDTCYIQRDYEHVERRGDNEDFFAFCKTAARPYDAVVVAVLVCLHHHIPMFRISSDAEILPDYKDLEVTYNLKSNQKNA